MTRQTRDLRGLAAPEPMFRILCALADLGAGDEFEAILPHEPGPLYELLRERGAVWKTLADEPGRFVLLVKKGP